MRLLLLLSCLIIAASASANEDYTAYAKEQRARENTVIAPYLLEVKALTQKSQANIQLNDTEILPMQNRQKYQSNIFIFVSFSMPKQSLRDWLFEAEKIKANVMLRGLVNNSFKDTTKALYEVIKDTNTGGFALDPTMFQKYHITKVPAVVISDKLSQDYDVVYGDVSLEYALKTIMVKGEPSSSKAAQQALITLRGNTNV